MSFTRAARRRAERDAQRPPRPEPRPVPQFSNARKAKEQDRRPYPNRSTRRMSSRALAGRLATPRAVARHLGLK